MRINNQTYGLTYALNTKSNQSKEIKTYNNKFVSVPSESIIASKGLNFRSKNLNQLYDEYNWYINHDHTPAIDAFLKIDDDKDSMDGFLGAILNTDDRSYQFIDSVVRQPRNTSKITKKLSDKEYREILTATSPNDKYWWKKDSTKI